MPLVSPNRLQRAHDVDSDQGRGDPRLNDLKLGSNKLPTSGASGCLLQPPTPDGFAGDDFMPETEMTAGIGIYQTPTLTSGEGWLRLAGLDLVGSLVNSVDEVCDSGF